MLMCRIAVLAAITVLSATVTAATPGESDVSVNISAEQLQFYQNKDGLAFANAWGEPSKGPRSNYIRLPANYGGSLHMHTSSYYGVVIRGTVSNERRAQPAQPLEPGSYWFQRGGEPHVTRCLSAGDCLIFVTSRGKFDIRPVVGTAVPPAKTIEPTR